MENGKKIIPCIYKENNKIYITNYDEYDEDSNPFFFIQAYVYPYFYKDSVNETCGYSLDNISEDDYDTTEIPGILVIFAVLKAISIYLSNEGDIDTSSGYEDLLIRYITMYNMNLDLPIYTIFTKMGQLNGKA